MKSKSKTLRPWRKASREEREVYADALEYFFGDDVYEGRMPFVEEHIIKSTAVRIVLIGFALLCMVLLFFAYRDATKGYYGEITDDEWFGIIFWGIIAAVSLGVAVFKREEFFSQKELDEFVRRYRKERRVNA